MSFSALILSPHLNKNDALAIVDQNGTRRTSWAVFRQTIYHIADYAVEKKIVGIVPVYMERGVECFATLLGLNLAGVGVAPLSITTPADRCTYISEQVQNPTWTADTFANAMATTVTENDWIKVIENDSHDDKQARYVVFTSGSTGNPKGVMLSDRAMADGICRASGADFFDYDERDIALQMSSLSFIALAADGFAPLYSGCPVHVLPENVRGDLSLISDYINRHGVTKLFMSPQMYRNFEGAPSLRCVATGSDRIINLAPKGHRLIGVYGLSESVGFTFHYDIEKAMSVTPIGVPTGDVREYVIDDAGNLADEGELCLSGAISHGYFNDDELTKQVFTENPFCNEAGHEILLHSGDIVRRLPEGGYRYINRRDNMLKINGQRVEPGEIETVMISVEGVKVAVVKGFSDDEGRSLLCAFYTSDGLPDEDRIREVLSGKLPHYMVPSIFVHLDEMPLNSNGKINRKELKMPDLTVFRNEYRAPSDDVEDALCKGFETALHLERVGVDDNFFRIGGDSIGALAVVRECENIGLSTADIFAGGTPSEIAKILHGKLKNVYAGLPNNLPKSPLTDSQMGVYLECMVARESKMYNIPMHITMARPAGLSADEIKSRIDRVFAVHPALYSHLNADDEIIYMVRETFPKDGICVIANADDDESVNIEIRPFDLINELLCRVNAFLTENKLHILIDISHIVADGTSMSLICRQLCESISGKEPTAETVDAFSLFEAEKRLLASPEFAEAKKYYDELLSGVDAVTELIADEKPSENPKNPAKRYSLKFQLPDLKGRLKGTDITENTLFMGAFGYALAKMTGQSDAVFAAGENGRRSSALDGTAMMLVRTLPVVLRFDETQPGTVMLKQLQAQFFRSMSLDSISFGELAREYGVSTDVSFVYQSEMLSGYHENGFDAELTIRETGDAFTKMNASVLKYADGFEFRMDYRSDLYHPRTIERFVEVFVKACTHLLTDEPLSAMPLVSDEDRRLLSTFHGEKRDYDKSKTIVDVFGEIVKKYPDKIAVSCRENRYTYARVDDISNRLAAFIHSRGIGREQTVSILIKRSEWIEIASMGVMKAGAIYEPLDPTYPTERLTFMTVDADTKLLIADRTLIGLLPEYHGEVLYLDEIEKLPEAGDVSAYAPKPEDTYVLLYTSGTTGKPKGCMLAHSNILAFAVAHSDTLQLDENCVVASYASFGFDAHMADLYPAIYNGCELAVVPDEIRLDFPALKEFVESVGITHLCMTTQVARQFAIEYPNMKSLRCISCGGEKLLTIKPSENFRFYNLYGPTEGTICVTHFFIDREYENIPIGTTMLNENIYIADPFGRVVPVGVPGELIICGPQVGRGYLNRPEQTAKVFVKNTYDDTADEEHQNCYRTGDIVRYLDDGNIEFIGRRDLQVKIRGFRIELGEVEKVIRDYPSVNDATVVVAEENGTKCIHAYVVSNEKIDISELHRFIKSQKPAYMVPSATMQIDAIPLTPNHKVDKRKLPPIIKEQKAADDGARSMTELEKSIVEILKSILGEGNYGVSTEFADLGITSISSIKLATQLYKKFGLRVNSKEILDGGTILSIENKMIAEWMENHGKTVEEKPKTRLDTYPLTQTQMGIYLDSLRAGMDAYNIPLICKIPNEIDVERLKKAVISVISAHPSMLCYISADEKGDVSILPQPDLKFTVETEKVDEMPPKATEFEFGKKPLFRVRILEFGLEKYLMIEAHHIISDGTSLSVLTDEIDRAYSGETIAEEEYSVYDLTLDEQAARNGKNLTQAKEVYDAVFRGISADYLPETDFDEVTKTSVFDHRIKADINTVKKFCKDNNISESVLFTGVFAMIISKFTGHEDAYFATVHNGRTDPRYERLAAMLVKTLPIYVDLKPDMKVCDFLSGLDKEINLLKRHDIYSFADAVRDYGVNADVLFVYQGRMMSSVRLDGRELEIVNVENPVPKAEISAELFEEDTNFRLTVEYNGGSYSEDWMASFADAYSTCLNSLISVEKIGEIDILSDLELEKYHKFNDTDIAVEYHPPVSFIEKHADETPELTAIIAKTDAEVPVTETLTYAELDRMGNEIADRLIDCGIRPTDVVGIITNRTKEIYLAEVGVWKAGGAFLFLSPSYPDERVEYVAAESGLKAIITTAKIAKSHEYILNNLGVPVIFADDLDHNYGGKRHEFAAKPDDLAYLIYTSGSTGKPKGVMVTNKGLVNLTDLNEKNVHIMPFVSPVIAATAAFTFDASIVDGISMIINGVTVCIATDEEIHDPAKYRRMCLDHGVTGFIATPSFIMSMLDLPEFADAIKGMHAIISGGEAFPVSLYEKLRAANPDLVIINGYGPSETTVACSAKVLKSANDISIGQPINNTKIYIVDRQNHILPKGALGELVILGDGVGKGYMNRDDLTKKAFFTLHGLPAYRSGDLALIDHDDEIRFHGRIDNQVKLRGLRVELGEIESAINRCDGVKTSIVTVNGAENNRFLAAYYTAERDIESHEIIAEISKTLAEYMVPRVFIRLDAMPMTANGKIDKRALPEPQLEKKSAEFVAPRTEAETKLCQAFAEVLGLEKVGVTDDFFELGGTSLTATKIAMYAISHGIDIAYKDVFANPTAEKLAALVGTETESETFTEAVDYTDADRALCGNTWRPGDKVTEGSLGNVLITGATGFLGMHVLKHFLDNEEGEVFCLLRKGGMESVELRLAGMYFYYFDASIEGEIGKRIHCIDGDITDRDAVAALEKIPFHTLFNCAACVKHFTNSDILEKVNVEGVANLVELCRNAGRRLVHVSTISVAGEGVNGNPAKDKTIHENELFFGQTLENQYIVSKFKAEKIILDAVAAGLDAKIMRAGNLMPRYSDGEFQINYLTNGFMRRLHGFYALGCIPYSQLSGALEFSPIDETAGAMIALAKTDRRYTVFHANNIHTIYMSDVVRAMNSAGLKVEAVDDAVFGDRLNSALKDTDTNNAVGGLIAYLSREHTEDRYMIGYDNSFTANILNCVGYSWNITDDAYIVNALKQLEQLGFFELEI